jgi:hypothetical protein
MAASNVCSPASSPPSPPRLSRRFSRVPYLWNNEEAPEIVRTTIDIPAPVYRKLKEQAARQGCSVRDLVTRGIHQVLLVVLG